MTQPECRAGGGVLRRRAGLRVQAQQLAGLVEAFRLPAAAGVLKALR